jgi:hypothetical protein
VTRKDSEQKPQVTSIEKTQEKTIDGPKVVSDAKQPSKKGTDTKTPASTIPSKPALPRPLSSKSGQKESKNTQVSPDRSDKKGKLEVKLVTTSARHQPPLETPSTNGLKIELKRNTARDPSASFTKKSSPVANGAQNTSVIRKSSQDKTEKLKIEVIRKPLTQSPAEKTEPYDLKPVKDSKERKQSPKKNLDRKRSSLKVVLNRAVS